MRVLGLKFSKRRRKKRCIRKARTAEQTCPQAATVFSSQRPAAGGTRPIRCVSLLLHSDSAPVVISAHTGTAQGTTAVGRAWRGRAPGQRALELRPPAPRQRPHPAPCEAREHQHRFPDDRLGLAYSADNLRAPWAEISRVRENTGAFRFRSARRWSGAHPPSGRGRGPRTGTAQCGCLQSLSHRRCWAETGL